MARPLKSDRPAQGDDRYFITALARGLDVLSCFKSTDKSLSNHQIVERCKLPKSTVTRITATLSQLGYLRPSDEIEGRFSIGMKTVALGTAAIAGMDIRRIARPILQEMADQTRSGVSIAVRSNFSLVYVEVCNGSGALGLAIQIGSRVRLGQSAIARAYLAAADERERARIGRINALFTQVQQLWTAVDSFDTPAMQPNPADGEPATLKIYPPLSH